MCFYFSANTDAPRTGSTMGMFCHTDAWRPLLCVCSATVFGSPLAGKQPFRKAGKNHVCIPQRNASLSSRRVSVMYRSNPQNVGRLSQ